MLVVGWRRKDFRLVGKVHAHRRTTRPCSSLYCAHYFDWYLWAGHSVQTARPAVEHVGEIGSDLRGNSLVECFSLMLAADEAIVANIILGTKDP